MLEHYFVKPSTIDRIRGSWLGSQIENYVGCMEANGYSSRTVLRRLPRYVQFPSRSGEPGQVRPIIESKKLQGLIFPTF
jgi:hypothetical protein